LPDYLVTTAHFNPGLQGIFVDSVLAINYLIIVLLRGRPVAGCEPQAFRGCKKKP
jgi:hypothetical protein